MNQIEANDHQVCFGQEIKELDKFINQLNPSKVAILVDENTKSNCLPLIKGLINREFKLIEFAAGEQHKNLDTCQHVWQQLTEAKFDRKGLLINLGGGVISDLGGFVASTYKRGIRFLNIPTTLLSQVDASVGGKLGVDLNGLKNQVGLFANPQRVYILPKFLKTLPEKEVKAGFAEIIKHAMIASPEYWDQLIAFDDWTDFDALEALIYQSVEIKNQIVLRDPKEKGDRKALNFGHTIGHAVETFSLENDSVPLLHGEAVAIGLLCEAWLSKELTGLPEFHFEAIEILIRNQFTHYAFGKGNIPRFLELMKHDKKNDSDGINFTLLPKIGQFKINQIVESELIIQALNYYREI